MGFGWPTRYLLLDINEVEGGVESYDRSVKEASDEYKGRMVGSLGIFRIPSGTLVTVRTCLYLGQRIAYIQNGKLIVSFLVSAQYLLRQLSLARGDGAEWNALRRKRELEYDRPLLLGLLCRTLHGVCRFHDFELNLSSE